MVETILLTCIFADIRTQNVGTLYSIIQTDDLSLIILLSCNNCTIIYNFQKICVVVVVFFTLTDRASTIPNNTRGCQSGTWSAGQKKIKGTSTKLQ